MASAAEIQPGVNPLLRRPSDASPTPGEDGGDSCRICRGEGTPDQPLFYPCKCSGSIKYVHQDCLMEWLSHSQKKYCELCKTAFRFTKLYDQSMPESVPWLLFAKQAVVHAARAIGRGSRYTLVIFVWLIWLPWTIRQIWRGLFWMADGSLTSATEVKAYANQVSNVSTIANTTATDFDVPFGVGLLLPTLTAVLSLFDPKFLIHATFRILLNVAIQPNMPAETLTWDGKSFLFAPIPRPPSLLSDIQAFSSATRLPILNNAIIDVLEGQLVCLTIVTAFILVFLIREWVINQQPLLNMPDADGGENEAQALANNEGRPLARRRRRPGRRLHDRNAQLENGVVQGADQRPALRRNLTENNILVPADRLGTGDRPVPQRAASLMTDLQQLEANVRLLSDLPTVQSSPEDLTTQEPLQSPPLERGIFDELGQIQRSLEEQDTPASIASPSGLLTSSEDSSTEQALPADTIAESSNTTLAFGGPDRPADEEQTNQHKFTFESAHQFAEPASSDPQLPASREIRNSEDASTEFDAGFLQTPESSSTSRQPNTLLQDTSQAQDAYDSDASNVTENTETISPAARVVEVPDTFWLRLSNWLWHTDDFMPDLLPPPDTDVAEIVADVEAEAPFVPVRDQRAAADDNNGGAAAQDPQPNIQDGIDLNDPNAIEEAEDLEGIFELIGMEGPLSAMVQNLIFSVFLITLTLSGSVWCPYIWGKITLLCMAHPIGVFVRAPIFLLSRTADFIIDLGLFSIGLLGVLVKHVTKVLKLVSLPVWPALSNFLDTRVLDKYSLSLSHRSGARLEKTLAKTLLIFSPDLPTFSVQSHHVLRVFRKAFYEAGSRVLTDLSSYSKKDFAISWHGIFTAPVSVGNLFTRMPNVSKAAVSDLQHWLAHIQRELRPLPLVQSDDFDRTLIQWSSKEKIVCILLGYILFSIAGTIYLKVAHYALGLRKDEKVPGFLADTLRQAGGVLKVVVIIGIEMIAFPLYCGTMLDFALLKVFEGATIASRLNFFVTAPFTAVFIHWFLGTCYMFHFALFVSMCRKIMRKGVLYFIRDPDDPAFHPVRDVLERPVATQLGKIAFSAFVYGSLLIICLGGIVTGLDQIGDVLPLRWGVRDPFTLVPGDIIFYNFLLPVILRKINVTQKISAFFGWWFRACAAGLRLSDFLFDTDVEEEKQAATFMWRRFAKALFTGKKDTLSVDDAISMVKSLAKSPERLFIISANPDLDTETQISDILGPDQKFNVFTMNKKKSKVLVEMKDDSAVAAANAAIEKDAANPSNKKRLKRVSHMKLDLKIDMLPRRTKPVDRAAGTYARTPAKDSVRIPKGTKVFIPVDEKNNRIDGEKDTEESKKDIRFTRIYIPNHFRARILTFVGFVWISAATCGLTFTVGPLVVGRALVRTITSRTINDLYAFTIGLHVFGVSILVISTIVTRWESILRRATGLLTNTRQAVPQIVAALKRLAGLIYLALTIGLLLPLALSLLAELYINIPAYALLVASSEDKNPSANPFISTTQGKVSTPIIHFIQTWAMGLLYLRIVVRIMTHTPTTNTRPATAIRAITRNGVLNPDVRLATRALVLPVFALSGFLLGLPPTFAGIAIALFPRELTDEEKVTLYRFHYPLLLSAVVAAYLIVRLQMRIKDWRIKIRDEVYLIGERLHNFPKEDEQKAKQRRKSRRGTMRSVTSVADGESGTGDKDKGKGKEIADENTGAASASLATPAGLEDSADLAEELQESFELTL